MSSSDINERAREFVLATFPSAANDLGLMVATQTMAAFATKEREEAVREFIAKYDDIIWAPNEAQKVFREMFNKDLEGSDS